MHALAEPNGSPACRLWLRNQVRDRDAAASIFRQLHREELLRLHLRPGGWWTPTKVVVLTAVILTGAIAAIALDTAHPPPPVCVPAATAMVAPAVAPVVAPPVVPTVEPCAPPRPACAPEPIAAPPH